jgi:hypothetical protein
MEETFRASVIPTISSAISAEVRPRGSSRLNGSAPLHVWPPSWMVMLERLGMRKVDEQSWCLPTAYTYSVHELPPNAALRPRPLRSRRWLAALQAASGARIAALAEAEAVPVLERGTSMPGDPQHGWLLEFPPVRVAEHASNGGTVRVDPLADGVPHSRPRARRNDVDLAVLSLRVGV